MADPETPQPSAADRRAFPRVLLRMPLRYRPEDQLQWRTAVTRDISAVGLLFETEDRLTISSRITFLLQVPGDPNPRHVSGLIMRTELEEDAKHYLIGAKFMNLDEADRRHLAAALHNSDIMALLRQAAQEQASDVHVSADHPPLIRIAGKLQPLRPEPISGPELRHMIYTLMDERQRQTFERNLELNFSLSVEPTVRYRVNVHSQRSNVEAAFRRIEPSVRTIAELKLPKHLEQFAEMHDGLVLVTGPTGAGKTTAMAAMVHHINCTREAVVITLENPIEYVHGFKKSLIKQREIGTDTRSFPAALREAMRQDPDVIVVGEVRDEETMKTALDAAETGHLVLATFPAADTVQSIIRVVHFFQKERQQEVLRQLAGTLRAIVSLRLLPHVNGLGMIPASEMLINTAAMGNLIRTGGFEQIPMVIQTGMKQGMHTMDSSLEALYNQGLITGHVYKQHKTSPPNKPAEGGPTPAG